MNLRRMIDPEHAKTDCELLEQAEVQSRWLGSMRPGRLGTYGTDRSITDPTLSRSGAWRSASLGAGC